MELKYNLSDGKNDFNEKNLGIADFSVSVVDEKL